MDEYGELLKQSEEADNTPSCSLADPLDKQDLYINSSLVKWDAPCYGAFSVTE